MFVAFKILSSVVIFEGDNEALNLLSMKYPNTCDTMVAFLFVKQFGSICGGTVTSIFSDHRLKDIKENSSY